MPLEVDDPAVLWNDTFRGQYEEWPVDQKAAGPSGATKTRTVRRDISIVPRSCVGCACVGRLAFNEFEAVMERGGYPMTRGELTKAAVGELTVKPDQLSAAVLGAYFSDWLSVGQADHCLEQIDVQRVVALSGVHAWKDIRRWFGARKKRTIDPSETNSMLITRMSHVDDFAKIEDEWNGRLTNERQGRLSQLAVMEYQLANPRQMTKSEWGDLAIKAEALKRLIEDENVKSWQTLLGDSVLADIRRAP
jgi:hypothetical protein